MTKELQRLYDSEINFRVSCFWDAGVDWALGDEGNGFKASGNAATVEEALRELFDAASTHFPESFFATGKR